MLSRQGEFMARDSRAAATSGEPIEILLVEDDPDDAELTQHALRRMRVSNHVHVCRTGQEALTWLMEVAARGAALPRLVLLDLNLPDMTGAEVVQQIRSDPALVALTVVVLTGAPDDIALFDGQAAGANSYIVKPVDAEDFRDVVGQLGFYWLILNRPPVEVSLPAPRAPRVLYAEDDPSIGRAYALALEAEGFQIDLVADGDQALERLRLERYDIFLLDLHLPTMDGFQVLNELRAAPRLPLPTPVVVILSADDGADTMERVFKLGAISCLSKSEYTPSRLARRLTEWISQSRGRPA
ncbi:MAG: hypothetical protein QOK05_2887 [Chloroflexota bacterium]|jgi:CheY-like chemotaxis protein|nr:hypothetical protein [Chloroflexota bacterium]